MSANRLACVFTSKKSSFGPWLSSCGRAYFLSPIAYRRQHGIVHQMRVVARGLIQRGEPIAWCTQLLNGVHQGVFIRKMEIIDGSAGIDLSRLSYFVQWVVRQGSVHCNGLGRGQRGSK